MTVALRVRALRQGYERHLVLTGLDFALRAGVTGLLGPNGAGKSTLLRTLATVTPPRAGEVTVAGRVIRTDRGARRARELIGYLPQQATPTGSFTVFDAVRYSAWLRRVPDRQADGATRQAIAAVGLADRSGSRVSALSGGMRQRCRLAQSIVGGPRILLLDEPTVGLDPAQRLEFRELVRAFVADDPTRAVLISTHLIEDIAALCQRVVVVCGGAIAFDGSPADMGGLGGDGPGDSAHERGYLRVLRGASAR
ncbi:MAG TPA: ATP-binding cassette domain-containing protein [Pilimelia sp.]|nr:ATP-binding cassette domain-containing protein [Pilimelia sp.]